MAMVNGKIVGAKAKKLKKSISKSKSVEDKPVEKQKKEKTAPDSGKTTKVKKKEKAERPKKQDDLFRIAIGTNTFLSAELANDDAGNRVVAVRKWYNTKNDPELKPARGGFNMAKSSEIKILAVHLKNLAKALDES